MAKDDDLLKDAKEAYDIAVDAFSENRTDALDDLRFARLGEQWPEKIREKRAREGRPMLTINRLPSFIRQVVNDARQNKPQMAVKPLDSKADVKTAEVLGGLLRAIEIGSKAEVAYDTAVDYAVTCGFGYWRIDIDYAFDDAFEKVLKIKRIGNPFSVWGDPHSTEADSSDWNTAFVTTMISEDEFSRKYRGAEKVDWDADGYSDLKQPWREDEQLMLAEWWTREETEKEIVLMTDGSVIDAETFEKNAESIYLPTGNVPVNSRWAKGHKITHRLMTGAEILETTEWAGCYIPIVPVYGDEVNVEGKRYFRSLVRDAKDPQRMLNYWRTTATELTALAPRVPYIGPEEAFHGEDQDKWQTANTENHPYLAYAGQVAPQRQPLDSGPAAGALMEASQASDDLKSIMGLYDASLGARSNETSGKAILARQREGDVSTFHFIDNLNRAIQHSGRILVDLIPKVYSGERIVRIVSPENEESAVQLAPEGAGAGVSSPSPVPAGVTGIFDISVGKYDVVVDTGPSFTTRREEAAEQMATVLQSAPDTAPAILPNLVKNLDWPGADKISERLTQLYASVLPPEPAEGEMDPQMQMVMDQAQQQAEEAGMAAEQAMGQAAQLQQELEAEKASTAVEMEKLALEREKLRLEEYKLQTERIKAQAELEQARFMQAQPPKPETSPVNVSMPENVGQSIAESIIPALAQNVAPVVAQAVQQAIASTPIQVNQPKMKRTPVRAKNGMIEYTIDEPVIEAMN